MDFVHYYEAPKATRQQLARVHDLKYIDKILTFNEKQGYTYLDPDTLLMPETPQAALRAAGALIHATDLVLTNKHKVAFCNIRPPRSSCPVCSCHGFLLFQQCCRRSGACH
jgi:acetoin utilization deacetylase AcuC-like enzyme